MLLLLLLLLLVLAPLLMLSLALSRRLLPAVRRRDGLQERDAAGQGRGRLPRRRYNTFIRIPPAAHELPRVICMYVVDPASTSKSGVPRQCHSPPRPQDKNCSAADGSMRGDVGTKVLLLVVVPAAAHVAAPVDALAAAPVAAAAPAAVAADGSMRGYVGTKTVWGGHLSCALQKGCTEKSDGDGFAVATCRCNPKSFGGYACTYSPKPCAYTPYNVPGSQIGGK